MFHTSVTQHTNGILWTEPKSLIGVCLGIGSGVILGVGSLLGKATLAQFQTMALHLMYKKTVGNMCPPTKQ